MTRTTINNVKTACRDPSTNVKSILNFDVTFLLSSPQQTLLAPICQCLRACRMSLTTLGRQHVQVVGRRSKLLERTTGPKSCPRSLQRIEQQFHLPPTAAHMPPNFHAQPGKQASVLPWPPQSVITIETFNASPTICSITTWS